MSCAGEAPRKTALIQLCFASRLARSPAAVPAPHVSSGPHHSIAGAGGGAQQQPAACAGPRHTCLLLHVAHTGITPTLAKLLASPQVLPPAHTACQWHYSASDTSAEGLRLVHPDTVR